MINSIGLIESKGLVALVEAADVILKNSPVKILGIKKLENGIVSLSIYGESEYVKSAVESATEAGKRVGEIYAYSVVDNPSDELLNIISEIFDLEDGNFSNSLKTDIKLVEKKKKKGSILEEISSLNESTVIKSDKEISTKISKSKQEKILSNKPSSVVQKKSRPVKVIYSESGSDSKDSLSTIERLRQEALGLSFEAEKRGENDSHRIKIENKNKIPSNSRVDFELINGMNVHKLRNYARGFEDFPIKGRQISKAKRDELIDLFKTIS